MWCLSNIAWGIRRTGQEATIKEVPEPSHFLEYLLVSLQRLRNHQRESNRRAEDQSSKNCNSREVAEASRQWIKNHEDRLLSWSYPMGRDVICSYQHWRPSEVCCQRRQLSIKIRLVWKWMASSTSITQEKKKTSFNIYLNNKHWNIPCTFFFFLAKSV